VVEEVAADQEVLPVGGDRQGVDDAVGSGHGRGRAGARVGDVGVGAVRVVDRLTGVGEVRPGVAGRWREAGDDVSGRRVEGRQLRAGRVAVHQGEATADVER